MPSRTSSQGPRPVSISHSPSPPTNPTNDLLLITGATGHIGFRVLLQTLTTTSYNVRLAVRSAEKIKTISNHAKITALQLPPGRLSFTIVPDLTRRGAYDEAVRDVLGVIHIASPLMSNSMPPPSATARAQFWDDNFVRPAVRGTTNMLSACKSENARGGKISRVIITSSITALIPYLELSGQERSSRWVAAEDRIELDKGPYTNEFQAYAASKVAALGAAEGFMSQYGRDRLGFDLLHLHPSFVEGRNDLATSPREVLKGTNAIILGIALGQKFEYSTMGQSVSLDDVATAHVRAMDVQRVREGSYILSGDCVWDDVVDVVEKRFPSEVRDKVLSVEGGARSHVVFVDGGDSRQVFGLSDGVDGEGSFEEQVVSVVGHYLELRSKSGKKMTLRRA